MTTTEYSVPASAFIAQLVDCGVTDIVTVPDYVQASVHMMVERGMVPGIRNVNCATEDEAVCIALGLWIGGRRPVLMIQNQGVYASANSLRSAGVSSQFPLVLLVGQWGRELANLGKDPSQSVRREVRRTEPLLDALEIEWLRVEHPDDIAKITKAFEISREQQKPVAVLIGAHTSWQ